MCRLAANILQKTNDPAVAAEAVCLHAIATESRDNVSVMIVLLGGGRNSETSESSTTGAASFLTNQKSVEFIPGSLIPCPISTEYLEAYIGMCMRVRKLLLFRTLPLFLILTHVLACLLFFFLFFFFVFTQTLLNLGRLHFGRGSITSSCNASATCGHSRRG